MNSGKGQVAEGERKEASISRCWSLAPRLAPLAFSCAALAMVFLGLLQLDMPIVRYVRSVTIHLPWDQLTVPWMAFTSNAGNWIGAGEHLLIVSAALLAAGWTLSKAPLTRAGLETLLAHGVAALMSNILKHLLGRPRPKFVHSGEWHFAPSWASGLDSFPSGHTTATFAVTTVLTKRFPWSGPVCIAVALFVGVSRVLRGSHFPTDVFGGAVIGILSGFLVTAPWREWRQSLAQGLRHAATGATILFALLWVLARPADRGAGGMILLAAGLLVTGTGLWLRGAKWVGAERPRADRQDRVSVALVAYGLASMTTAPLVVAAAGFACLAFALGGADSRSPMPPASNVRRIAGEAALVGSVLLGILILVEGRGVLPFQ